MSPLIIGCLLATWLVWGSTYLAIKFALESFAPYWQMGTRFIAAGVLLTVWLKWRGVPWPNAVQWRNAMIIGALMLGGGMGGTAVAETTVASGLVVAFIAIQPVVQAGMQMFWGHRPSKIEWLGIAVGVIGVWMLVQGQGFGASPGGLIAICIAIFCWGLGSVLSQRALPLAPGPMGYASEMLLGGLVLLGLSWFHDEPMNVHGTAQATAAWLYLVVFGSLIAFNAYMVLLARVSTGLATSYSFVNPVIALALGVWLGAEKVTLWEWGCAGVILLGVIIILRAAQQKRG